MIHLLCNYYIFIYLSQLRAILPSRGHLTKTRDILVALTGDSTDIGRNANLAIGRNEDAKHPTTHMIASHKVPII